MRTITIELDQAEANYIFWYIDNGKHQGVEPKHLAGNILAKIQDAATALDAQNAQPQVIDEDTEEVVLEAT